MASEEQEQVELARGQLERATTFAHFVRRGVDLDVTGAEALLWHPVCRGAAAQHGAHARDELPRRERLRHIIVGTELEPDDPVRLLTAGGQHDHRQLRAVTDPAAESEPVRAGQHQVKHDEARPLALQKLTRGVPVARLQRRKALAPQILDDHVPDGRLVVDDQNRLHGTILPASPYKTLKTDCRRTPWITRTYEAS